MTLSSLQGSQGEARGGETRPCGPAELAVAVLGPGRPQDLEGALRQIEAVVAEMGVATRTYVVLDADSPERLESIARSSSSERVESVTRNRGAEGLESIALSHRATVIRQKGQGYGGALQAAFAEIPERYVATVDSQPTGLPSILRYLYEMRGQAEIVVASRYAEGGFAEVPPVRYLASRLLNWLFRRVLSLPVHDLSSGFRLYDREALRRLAIRHVSYAALPEILTKAVCAGYQVAEIPFHYRPGRAKRGPAHLARFAADCLSVLWEMWHVRNSVASADYDWRAFHSRIPLQRWWQRRRYRIVLNYIGARMRVLDAGCGSSQILNGAPQAVGLDIQRAKLRFVRRPGRGLVNGSVAALPFRDGAFQVVICSEVIEHVPEDEAIFRELLRVLEPGGSLVLGTPDYGSWQWPLLERLYGIFQPAGYAGEHITHYTRTGLLAKLRGMGLRVEGCRTIWNAELIVHARKPSAGETPAPQ